MKNAAKQAIVTCATPNWLAPAAVTLLTCARHGAAEIDLIIVCPDASPQNFADLKIFNSRHGTNIILTSVKANDLAPFAATTRLGLGTLLRLRLDQYLDRAYRRVVYIDSDVLAETDVTELLSADLGEFALGAVESIAMLPFIKRNAGEHLQSINFNAEHRYFNAGVLLFDWQRTLADNVLGKAMTVLCRHPKMSFADQDALNIVVAGKYQHLEQRWNNTKKAQDFLSLKPGLRHFNGRAKPWNCPTRIGYGKYRKIYESALLSTPWAAFLDQPQMPWPIKDNWRAIVRRLSFRRQAQLTAKLAIV